MRKPVGGALSFQMKVKLKQPDLNSEPASWPSCVIYNGSVFPS